MIGHKSCVNALATSPGDGIYLASGGDDTNILLWNLWDEETLYSKPAVFNSVFSKKEEDDDDDDSDDDSENSEDSSDKENDNDSDNDNSQNHQHELQLQHQPSIANQSLPCYAGHKSNIFSIAFTPDGKSIFSCGLDSLIIQHDLERDCIAVDNGAEKFTRKWSAHDESSIHRICVNKAGSVLLSAGSDGMLCGWDLRSACNAIIKLQANQELWSVAFNPVDENLFAVGGDRGYLGLLDMRMVLGEKRSLIGSETIKVSGDDILSFLINTLIIDIFSFLINTLIDALFSNLIDIVIIDTFSSPIDDIFSLLVLCSFPTLLLLVSNPSFKHQQ